MSPQLLDIEACAWKRCWHAEAANFDVGFLIRTFVVNLPSGITIFPISLAILKIVAFPSNKKEQQQHLPPTHPLPDHDHDSPGLVLLPFPNTSNASKNPRQPRPGFTRVRELQDLLPELPRTSNDRVGRLVPQGSIPGRDAHLG